MKTFAHLLLLLVAGCSSADRTVDSAIQDSAGVQIVTNQSVPPTIQVPDTAKPDLRIGSVDGDSVYQLYRVSAIRTLPDGGVVVANSATRELRFYDANGGFRSAVGGDGAGPGEFRAIDRIDLVQDSIWVSDPRLRRVSIFTLSGHFVRSIELSASPDLRLSRLRGVFGDGTLLVEVPISEEPGLPGIQSFRSRLYHVDRGGAVLDSLGTFETGQHLVQIRENGPSSVRLPFSRTAALTTANAAFYFGTGEAYEVKRYSAEGRLNRIIRYGSKPPPVNEKDLSQYVDAVAKVNPDPNARQILADLYRDVTLPATKPAYLSFLLDARGRLWIEDYHLFGDTLTTWAVFEPDGRYTSTVSLPARFTLYEIGPDFVLGVRLDGSDVEYVERYRIPRQGADDRRP